MRLRLGVDGKDAAVPSFGSNIRTTVKAPRKGKGAAADGKGKDARRAPTFERGVANCLCCGKIYNSRTVTNDLLEFLGEHNPFAYLLVGRPASIPVLWTTRTSCLML